MRPDRRAFALACCLLAAACATMTGCAGYRLGTMLPPDIKTVYVPTFVNRTPEPFLEVDATKAVLEEIQKDGSLEIADADKADSVLKVTLVGLRLDPVAYRGDKKTAARVYRMYVTASVNLSRTAGGAVIVNNQIAEGEAIFEVFGDLSSSKLSAMPAVAEDLAHDIVEKVVEAW